MQKSIGAMTVFFASVVLLIGFMLRSDFPFPLIIGLHALAFAISASAGFLLYDQIDARGLSGILLLMGFAGIGIGITGVFFAIMPSAGILFAVLNIIVIIGVLNSS